MATQEAEKAVREQLKRVEEQLAELRRTTAGLRRDIGGAEGGRDAEDMASTLTSVEEQEALMRALEARRQALLNRLRAA